MSACVSVCVWCVWCVLVCVCVCVRVSERVCMCVLLMDSDTVASFIMRLVTRLSSHTSHTSAPFEARLIGRTSFVNSFYSAAAMLLAELMLDPPPFPVQTLAESELDELSSRPTLISDFFRS